MDMNQNAFFGGQHSTANDPYSSVEQYLRKKEESHDLGKVGTAILVNEFKKAFFLATWNSSSLVPQLELRGEEIRRLGRVFMRFDLAEPSGDLHVGWKPQRKLISMMEDRLMQRGSSLTAASTDPELTMDVLSELGNLLKLLLEAFSAMDVGRARRSRWRVNRTLKELILAELSRRGGADV